MRLSLTVLSALTMAMGCASTEAGPPSARDIEDAEVCALLSACVDFEGEFSSSVGGFVACSVATRDWAIDRDALTACVMDATDCAAAADCLNAGEAPGSCDPFATPGRCDGDIARVCRSYVQVAQDCAALGLSCVEDAAGQVFCGPPGACERSECDGNTLIGCRNGARYLEDCGEQVCVVAEELAGSAICAGEGEPCEGRIFRCDGDVAVSCRFGRIRRETCGPGLCSTTDGAFCMTSPECDGLPRCEGSSIVHCAGGVPSRVDCAQLGATTCTGTDGDVRCE